VFHDIPPAILDRMAYLEQIDARDRLDGTPKDRRLRQVTPDTGRFLALLAAGAPAGKIIEIGTSAGYSTLWLALACRETGRRLTSFEILENKARLARETFRQAGIEDLVELVVGEAQEMLPGYSGVAFCFLDAEKEAYADFYQAVVPNLVRGGLLAADNAISHREHLQPMIEMALNDPRVDGLVVPVGKGILLCRKRD